MANEPTAGSTARASGYEVGRPLGQCTACGAVIAPDAKFMAMLRETADGLARVDCCEACWPQLDRRDVLGFWKTTMPRPDARKKVFVDDEVLCGVFERLADATEAAKLNFRFVLGLILMRKRMIIYESSRQEGTAEIWKVRFRGRDDALDLLNPRINEEQVQEVSRQLSEILNEEL